MIVTLLVSALVLLVAVLVLQIVQLGRRLTVDLSPIQGLGGLIESRLDRNERALREEIGRNREEASAATQRLREDVNASLKNLSDSLDQRIGTLTQTSDTRLTEIRTTLDQRLQSFHEDTTRQLELLRNASLEDGRKLREEVGAALQRFASSLTETLSGTGQQQKAQLQVFSEGLDRLSVTNDQKLGTMRETIEQRLETIRNETGASAKSMREETAAILKASSEALVATLRTFGEQQKAELGGFGQRLDKLVETNRSGLDELKVTVEQRLKLIQEDNATKLEQMRATVDEKLQGTLEKRLGESFRLVSERLEQVQKGLGEMQTLATGVGDLKRVLTNVKSRGTWGEVQLGAMLEQMLTPEQFATNVSTKGAGERVEFAVKLPGRGEDRDDIVWLPIDAKFPVEDYQRLLDAQEKADPVAAEAAAKQLEARIKQCASDIQQKYLNPPKTVDFGILFLPTEGLFAEVLRRPGLAEHVQRESHVMIAGPTTLGALLTSLQMGFRTLAIQRRSSEVWNLLAAVKTEWSKYGEVLDKVKRKLDEASNTVEDAGRRTRAIGRKLRDVQELPAADAGAVLMLDGQVEDAGPEIETE